MRILHVRQIEKNILTQGIRTAKTYYFYFKFSTYNGNVKKNRQLTTASTLQSNGKTKTSLAYGILYKAMPK